MKTLSIKRVDHVSLTVADIEPGIESYTRVLGAELAHRLGPFDAAEIPPMEDGRDWTAAHINVPGARPWLARLICLMGLARRTDHAMCSTRLATNSSWLNTSKLDPEVRKCHVKR